MDNATVFSSNLTVGSENLAEKQNLRWNHHIAIATGFLTTFVLFYLIIYRSFGALMPFRKVLIVGAIADFYLLFVMTIGDSNAAISDGVFFYVLYNFQGFLPGYVHWIILGLNLTVTIVMFSVVTLEVWVRYFIIKHRQTPTTGQLAKPLLFMLFLNVIEFGFIYAEFNFMVTSGIDYQSKWYDQSVYVMVTDTKRNIWATANVTYRRCLNFASVFLAIWLAWLSVRLMRKQAGNISKKTQDLLGQFKWSLIVKTIVPVVTFLLPQVLNTFLLLTNMSAPSILNATSYLYFWGPTISSMSSLMLISSYRRLILRFFQPRCFSAPKTQNSMTTITRNSPWIVEDRRPPTINIG